MSDRKYRQRGYQDSPGQARRDDDRPQRPRRPPEPRDPRIARDPRVPNMPGFREVVRCARCGALAPAAIGPDTVCRACGTALHSCAQCTSFDPGAVYECRQKIPTRISPKDAKNTCTLFSPRVQVERETGSTPAPAARPPSSSTPRREPMSGARKAFDDLFKF
ncbi:MAG: hypothetical protein ABS36_13280 [Acidobacteria bacterium SCN 69-37]|nr:MAG: hypothetical protein ABS36_13280 [Acidobacteria bacterium SCN 69-37]